MGAMMTLSISYNSLSILLGHDDPTRERGNTPSSIPTQRLASWAFRSDSIRIMTLMEVTRGTHMYGARVVKDLNSLLDPDNIARVCSLQLQKLRVSS